MLETLRAFITRNKKYASYVLRHKYFVAKYCWREGLYYAAFIHDWSKFLPSEWFAYANYFYGEKIEQDLNFDEAWLHHQKRQKHHWQYWTLLEDEGDVRALEIPNKYVLEMLCDWKGAGMAQGKPDLQAWYLKNHDKMRLEFYTRVWVESLLGISSQVSQRLCTHCTMPMRLAGQSRFIDKIYSHVCMGCGKRVLLNSYKPGA
jgi:hypothetical protein